MSDKSEPIPVFSGKSAVFKTLRLISEAGRVPASEAAKKIGISRSGFLEKRGNPDAQLKPLNRAAAICLVREICSLPYPVPHQRRSFRLEGPIADWGEFEAIDMPLMAHAKAVIDHLVANKNHENPHNIRDVLGWANYLATASLALGWEKKPNLSESERDTFCCQAAQYFELVLRLLEIIEQEYTDPIVSDDRGVRDSPAKIGILVTRARAMSNLLGLKVKTLRIGDPLTVSGDQLDQFIEIAHWASALFDKIFEWPSNGRDAAVLRSRWSDAKCFLAETVDREPQFKNVWISVKKNEAFGRDWKLWPILGYALKDPGFEWIRATFLKYEGLHQAGERILNILELVNGRFQLNNNIKLEQLTDLLLEIAEIEVPIYNMTLMTPKHHA